jgi:CBS domain-containing protein
MASRRVHAIVAVEDAPVWSVVSDLDLVSLAAVGSAQDTAGDAATTEAVTIGPDETLDRAAQRVREHAIAHLLVAR